VKKAYITRELPAGVLRAIPGTFEATVWKGDGPVPREVLIDAVTDVEGLLCMLTDTIDEELLSAAPQLEVVSQMAVGVDNIDVAACERRGMVIGHTPGVLTETVADTAFALLASIVRRLPEGEKVVRHGEWGPWSPSFLNGRDLHRTTLGIIGMGRIGNAVARRALGFDMEIIYTSPRESNEVDAQHVSLADLLERADHVILCVALSDETHQLIGRTELSSMKTSAYLVNVSRGPVVDTQALVEALEEEDIAGAALDVTDPEPLPPDHPLLELSNCLVVPHIASSSLKTREAMAQLAVENLVAGLTGVELPARYRS
jgi:glyoxylate reductase